MLCRPSAQLLRSSRAVTSAPSPFVVAGGAAFSLPIRTYATPSGPPPSNFRLPKPERWDQSKESALDQAGRFFLLTEMARGMYVVLEQYFRPPYV
jgi:NADH dehydrogenase (ubiquinone) Fe-S protein 8